MLLKKIILLCIPALLCISCQKLLIKPDAVSEPEKNFEIFWNDINNGYPYFAEDGIKWQDRYETYKKQVQPSTSISQLYLIMTQMLRGFSDGHLSVSYRGQSYSNEKTQLNLSQLVTQDGFDGKITQADVYSYYNFKKINKGYLKDTTYRVVTASNGLLNSSTDTVCVSGYRYSDNILYINLTSFLTQYPLDDEMRMIFQKYPDSKGLILDLRMNEGGNLGTMWDAMSVFVPSVASEVRYAYVREKVGPLPENFDKEQYFAVFANGFNTKYTKPVVVLTNRLTISAAEHATMAMREIKRYNKKIKIIGDYTFGATSFVVERTLPCGIQYTLVNSKTSDINHQVVERTGVKPDEQVFITTSKILDDKDEQMERALEIINQDLF